MYGVVSYWVGEAGSSDLWLYKTEKEAQEGMNRLWEQSFNLALEDDNFDEKSSYHQEDYAVVVWTDGLYRYFEVVKANDKEEIL